VPIVFNQRISHNKYQVKHFCDFFLTAQGDTLLVPQLPPKGTLVYQDFVLDEVTDDILVAVDIFHDPPAFTANVRFLPEDDIPHFKQLGKFSHDFGFCLHVQWSRKLANENRSFAWLSNWFGWDYLQKRQKMGSKMS
jgi:hypothetical protein